MMKDVWIELCSHVFNGGFMEKVMAVLSVCFNDVFYIVKLWIFLTHTSNTSLSACLDICDNDAIPLKSVTSFAEVLLTKKSGT